MLLIGAAHGKHAPRSFDLHTQTLLSTVVEPLKADVYAVTDWDPAPRSAQPVLVSLARLLRPYLAAVGAEGWNETVGPEQLGKSWSADRMSSSQVSSLASDRDWPLDSRTPRRNGSALEPLGQLADLYARGFAPDTSSGAVALPALLDVPSPLGGRAGRNASKGCCGAGSTAHEQWYRLREAWRLMETHEQHRGLEPHAIVVKMRFDATPLGVWRPCARPFRAALRLHAVHAASDFMFWGNRGAMRVASQTWDAIPTFLKVPALRRPVPVATLLRSLEVASADSFSKARWYFFNKLLTVPFVDMGVRFRGPAGAEYESNVTVANLRRATAAGLTWLDPRKLRNLTASARKLLGPARVRAGIMSNGIDQVHPGFVSEKDFLVHLLLRGVVVCDLGPLANAFLYKGARRGRAAGPLFDGVPATCHRTCERRDASAYSRCVWRTCGVVASNISGV